MDAASTQNHIIYCILDFIIEIQVLVRLAMQ